MGLLVVYAESPALLPHLDNSPPLSLPPKPRPFPPPHPLPHSHRHQLPADNAKAVQRHVLAEAIDEVPAGRDGAGHEIAALMLSRRACPAGACPAPRWVHLSREGCPGG